MGIVLQGIIAYKILPTQLPPEQMEMNALEDTIAQVVQWIQSPVQQGNISIVKKGKQKVIVKAALADTFAMRLD